MAAEEAQTVAGEIIVTLESQEKHFPITDFNLTMDSTNEEILDAVAPAILEEFGINIKEEGEEGIYTVKKITESNKIYCFPKSPAGFAL